MMIPALQVKNRYKNSYITIFELIFVRHSTVEFEYDNPWY